jgi:hypothetical protein
MASKERQDAAARVSRVLLFVTGPHHDTEHPNEALVIIEKGMPSVRIFFDIMLDLAQFERAVQPRRCTPQRPVAAAVARDHRARAIEDRIDVIRNRAVVRGYCRKAIACCQKDRETACRAEVNDPGLAGAILEAFQPLPRGVNIVERRSLARRKIRHQGADAADTAAPGEQIQRNRKIPLTGQPIGMATRYVSQAEKMS